MLLLEIQGPFIGGDPLLEKRAARSRRALRDLVPSHVNADEKSRSVRD